MVYYCDLLVTNPVMVILQIMFVMTFLVTGLVWQFLSFPKITMCAFIVIGSSAKCCHDSTFVLLFVNTTFYQIYHHLKITVKFFLYLMNFVWIFPLKVLVISMLLHNWQRDLFLSHASHLSSSLVSGRVALTKCDFKFYSPWNK